MQSQPVWRVDAIETEAGIVMTNIECGALLALVYQTLEDWQDMVFQVERCLVHASEPQDFSVKLISPVVQPNQESLTFERDRKAQNCTFDKARSLREFA
jgi:hypothetical protein